MTPRAASLTTRPVALAVELTPGGSAALQLSLTDTVVLTIL
jgi:hypothetical protein